VVRSARAGHVRCSARFTGRKCRSRVWISLSAKPILASGRKTRKQAGHMSASDPSMLPELILQVGGRPHMNRAASASRPSASITSRDNVSLAGGTRSRVPPSFHSGVAITAPSSGAFLTGLATADWPSLRCGADALF
jgi:hypothetical protein